MAVNGCCSSPGNDEVFTAGVARRTALRYRLLGLLPPERRMVEPVVALGVDTATVVEIGGGVGHLQLALLAAGAARTVNLELSPHYEEAALALARRAGVLDRVERRLGDAAHLGEPLPPADVAVLHRVVCCTDDWRGMLDAALATSPRVVAMSLPHDGLVPRVAQRVGNRILERGGGGFRMRHHDPVAVVGHVEDAGFVLAHAVDRLFWRTVVLVRDGADAAAP